MNAADFSMLFSSMRDELRQYAARRLSHDAAEDVVAETFEVVWRKRDAMPQSTNDRRRFIMGITKTKVLQELDRMRRRPLPEAPAHDADPSAQTSPEDVARDVTERIAAAESLKELRATELELLVLVHLIGLGVAEGAACLGISPTAYTTRVSRLRQRCSALLHQLSDSQPHKERE